MLNLALHLATPFIITAQMDEDEFKYEFAKMMLRSTATEEFVAGRIDESDFLETLAECGEDIDAALAGWESGRTLLY